MSFLEETGTTPILRPSYYVTPSKHIS